MPIGGPGIQPYAPTDGGAAAKGPGMAMIQPSSEAHIWAQGHSSWRSAASTAGSSVVLCFWVGNAPERTSLT